MIDKFIDWLVCTIKVHKTVYKTIKLCCPLETTLKTIKGRNNVQISVLLHMFMCMGQLCWQLYQVDYWREYSISLSQQYYIILKTRCWNSNQIMIILWWNKISTRHVCWNMFQIWVKTNIKGLEAMFSHCKSPQGIHKQEIEHLIAY